MALVLDDHLLLDLLAEDVRGWLAEAVSQSAVYTTASWYYRVANASEHGSGRGSLSGRITAMAEPARTAVLGRIAHLPEEIGLIGPHTGADHGWAPDTAKAQLPERRGAGTRRAHRGDRRSQDRQSALTSGVPGGPHRLPRGPCRLTEAAAAARPAACPVEDFS